MGEILKLQSLAGKIKLTKKYYLEVVVLAKNKNKFKTI